MKSIGKSSDGRNIYMLWTTTENSELVLVEALQNTTNDSFWIPKLSFTGSLGSNIFEEKSAAYAAEKATLFRLEEILNKRKKNLELEGVING